MNVLRPAFSSLSLSYRRHHFSSCGFTVLTQGGYNTQLGFPWLPESQPLTAILATTASHLALGKERIKVVGLLAYTNDV